YAYQRNSTTVEQKRLAISECDGFCEHSLTLSGKVIVKRGKQYIPDAGITLRGMSRWGIPLLSCVDF
ncbi:hypothetical protein, partial [Anaeromusa acidaminophila]|uniref:hypothetical protein n=1 Tax=Anaeromusa acidaminophila TaxID=81464 RepID=UPI001C01A4D0